MNAALAALVEQREHGGVDPSTVDDVLARTIIDFSETTDNHAVWWNARAWTDAPTWDEIARERICDFATSLASRAQRDDGWVRIARSDVFDRATVGPVDLFLAAMAWGFGPRGYGWRRTSDVLQDAGETAVARAVGRLAVSPGTRAVWRAWSPGGAAKLKGVGTAFASKVAYFAGYDRVAGSGPLIADENTSWALWALAGIWDSRNTAACYEEYVRWAEARATDLQCRSDDIERALFMIGPEVQSEWRRSHTPK